MCKYFGNSHCTAHSTVRKILIPFTLFLYDELLILVIIFSHCLFSLHFPLSCPHHEIKNHRKDAAAAKPAPEFVPRKLSELSLGGSIDGSRQGTMQLPQQQQQTNGAFNSHSFNSSLISQYPNLQPLPRNSHNSNSGNSFKPSNPASFGSHPASKNSNLFDGNVFCYEHLFQLSFKFNPTFTQ